MQRGPRGAGRRAARGASMGGMDVVAIILAAGAGRRLGGPKALLDLGGHSALARCRDALRAGGVARHRIVLGHDADAVRATGDLSDARVLVNTTPEQGQTSSLRLGLEPPLQADAFVVQPVDHALVRGEDVARLAQAWRRRPLGVSIVVPSHDGRRGHPAWFDAELAAEFLALAPGEPAHHVVRADPARVAHVPIEDEWVVRDLDTPEDLAAARAALAARRDPVR